MNITIRPAEDSDLKALCDLYFEFHEFHAHYLPDFLRLLGEPTANELLEISQKLKDIIHGSDSTILVAENSSQVIGLAEVYIKHPDAANRGVNPTPYAHLQSLVVTQAYRRKRVGSMLLDAAEGWSRTRGAVDLTLDIWEYSAGPMEFYQKAGYRTFRRSLIKKV
ncbi:MAG TPA: GNAT family N-acetyltransferase [Anaerolineales bacterium]|nr:GNAT family N-acetyltransferase [Anaerolineales bacterium]